MSVSSLSLVCFVLGFESFDFNLMSRCGGRLWVSGQRLARWATRSVVHGKPAASSAARTVHLSTAWFLSFSWLVRQTCFPSEPPSSWVNYRSTHRPVLSNRVARTVANHEHASARWGSESQSASECRNRCVQAASRCLPGRRGPASWP